MNVKSKSKAVLPEFSVDLRLISIFQSRKGFFMHNGQLIYIFILSHAQKHILYTFYHKNRNMFRFLLYRNYLKWPVQIVRKISDKVSTIFCIFYEGQNGFGCHMDWLWQNSFCLSYQLCQLINSSVYVCLIMWFYGYGLYSHYSNNMAHVF